jgi:hypothetical protein
VVNQESSGTADIVWVAPKVCPRRFRSRLATIRELSSWINTAALARIYPFGWQGASATVVNMKSPNRFEVGANTGVVQVSRGVLHLESVP